MPNLLVIYIFIPGSLSFFEREALKMQQCSQKTYNLMNFIAIREPLGIADVYYS